LSGGTVLFGFLGIKCIVSFFGYVHTIRNAYMFHTNPL
jgi:hypothetical protein